MKTALLFPGQGSQYVGMSTGICERYEIARRVFEEAGDALGMDLKKLCDAGPLDELTKTFNSQPAILVTSVAMYRIYMEQVGVVPSCLAGHSLGELTALTCAGAIDFTDAVKLVRQRGLFMQEAVALGAGAMTAVMGMDQETIAAVCQKISTENNMVVISNYNSPEQTVISGHQDAVARAAEELAGKGARTIPLKVSAPFHSPLMQSAADKFETELHKYKYQDPQYPVLSNVTAKPYAGKDQLIHNLTAQLVQPVQWTASMAYLQSQGIELTVEIGPGIVLRDLMKKNVPGIPAFSYDKEKDVKKLMETIAPQTPAVVDKAAKLKLISRCLAIVVCTPNQNWNNDEYHKGVIEPYRKVQQMLEQLEKEDKEPTLEQMREALEMLRLVFQTKRTLPPEQAERFNQLFEETGTRSLFADFEIPA